MRQDDEPLAGLLAHLEREVARLRTGELAPYVEKPHPDLPQWAAVESSQVLIARQELHRLKNALGMLRRVAIDPLAKSEPHLQSMASDSLFQIIYSSFVIGQKTSRSQMPVNMHKHFSAGRSRAARANQNQDADARRKDAVLKVLAGRLVTSSKIVDAARADICREAGVPSGAKGYSTRSLQTVIGGLLAENK